MPRSLWEDQELFDEATNTCPTSSWKAIVVVSYHYEYNNGGFLAQYLEETRKENAIYYISKKMLPYEEKYSSLETLYACLQGFVDCKNGSFEVLNGKTAKWVLLLLEFEIKYVT